ncbi:MAG: family 20 glycosylhydrolase [Clostridiales bacterium]|nr:family 20 glycosylhydrolase [Clostridiales bacterium]
MFDSFKSLSGAAKGLSQNLKVIAEYGSVSKILEDIKTEGGEIKEIQFVLISPDELGKKAAEIFPDAPAPISDAYIILSEGDKLTAYSSTKAGLHFAAGAIKRHILCGGIKEGEIYNTPDVPFRCVKMYLPAREDIPVFFEIIELCVALGCNAVMLEIGGAMEYKLHPEINEGWVEYCDMFRDEPGATDKFKAQFDFHKNSIHSENGGGYFLTQSEVRALADYCEERGLEVIPEVPSLSHCDYLLTRHKELGERREDPWPDTYCPSRKESYELIFDVLTEVIEVFRPKGINIGHDEFYTLKLCPLCKDKDGSEIFAEDINKIHAFLKSKGVGTVMWGEKLLAFCARDGQPMGGMERYKERPNLYIPETYKARDLISKEIEILHWYWCVNRDCETQLFDRGFTLYFGNFSAVAMDDWKGRLKRGVKGICISNWSRLDILHMQRNTVLLEMALSSMMIWNPNYSEKNFAENIIKASDLLYRLKNYKTLRGKHIEIRHAVNLRHEHKPFVDGNFIDYEKDYLGEYEIVCKNGEKLTVPIYYGLNIGCMDGRWVMTPSSRARYVGNEFDTHILEPAYTCRIERDGGKTFYVIAVSVNDDVESIKLNTHLDPSFFEWQVL